MIAYFETFENNLEVSQLVNIPIDKLSIYPLLIISDIEKHINDCFRYKNDCMILMYNLGYTYILIDRYSVILFISKGEKQGLVIVFYSKLPIRLINLIKKEEKVLPWQSSYGSGNIELINKTIDKINEFLIQEKRDYNLDKLLK